MKYDDIRIYFGITRRNSPIAWRGGSGMTFKNQCLIEPKDITAIEIQCSECQYRSIRTVETWSQDSGSCANCGQMWFIQYSSDLGNLKTLVLSLRAISELANKGNKAPFTVRLEINCPDSTVRP